MDMITRIELEDAVKNHAKVAARVLEVAMVIADIDGSLNTTSFTISKSDWKVKNWRIDLKAPREGMEHLKDISCVVTFTVPWNKRPETIEFGKTDNDDFGYEEYREEQELERRVEFPYEYLITEGWEDAYRTSHKAKADRLRAFKAEQLAKSITEAEARLQNMYQTLKELKNA